MQKNAARPRLFHLRTEGKIIFLFPVLPQTALERYGTRYGLNNGIDDFRGNVRRFHQRATGPRRCDFAHGTAHIDINKRHIRFVL